MSDIVEILMHWHAGRKKAVVADSLGVDRGTVRKYVAKAEAAGLAPGGPALDREQWAALAREWFPELVDPRARSVTHDAIDAHRADIEAMLKTNTVTTVHQRLRDERGLAVGLTSFRRYVWREFPEARARELATPPRPRSTPARRPRSTTATSGPGSIRSSSACAACGPSSSCSRAPGTCSCDRC